ncbi:hypothetical protein J7I98_15590 [Streptomyces sp. ISL-98]|uniref:hypothetical protein n=1 Tax=Streptomyces sp. ISL-98 TaxID=2819192 RepID=UPI001BE5012F|nr:hypothetical protein [Streptomyces sp. ISL-98]MBT2507290.1 hypothetical protein [Streptomyces sp. ISL-98]
MSTTPPSHPDRYTVEIKPRAADADGHPNHGATLRTAVVEATGRTGESGYPRYEGEGVQAEIDPETRTVEAITLDGEELPYGWVAELSGGA